ncbi:copper resistance protein NlpE N-terminal domain-containing protein [Empedobacter brevis]|uniref:Copper resistance protein NlpE N-terminal domain-containing protein n=1 Tax=Empedobacter brevis TaxID=247 RepID=A0AAJ1VA03_9FLAO|nr:MULTISPECIES: copper resistance protein NlpE [Empedobacter]MDM1074342.1 copper resistance protein NlpE N-terminal domain-containing protein [Empedobacter brevis]
MNKFKFLTLAVIVAIFVSCGNGKSTDSSTKEEQTTTQTEQNGDFTLGIYSATLPCADCMGIYTHITFKKDQRAARSTIYLDSDGTSLNEYGTWTKNDSIIELTIPNTPKEYFLVKPNSTLVRLNTDKKEVSGELAKQYVFEKIEAYTSAQLNGTYQTNTIDKGYNQILELKADNDSIYTIKISFTGAAKGCTFEGKGQLVNNQIDVELNTINKDLKGTMTILFKDKTAEIFTSKFEDRLSLNFFCSGGTSLAGDYHKKE